MRTEDLARIWNAMYLSRCAYDNRLLPVGGGWSEPRMILDHGFAISRLGTLYVYFRGSEDVEDWLTNVDADPDENGVHSGFMALYASLLPAMVEAMSPFVETVIEFGGHSLGGALATIAAASTPGAESITFAAPRVFSASRAETLPWAGMRVANERDIVPHLPGRLSWCSYEHRALAYRFKGDSFDFLKAHSIEHSYSPALSGTFEGPMDLK